MIKSLSTSIHIFYADYIILDDMKGGFSIFVKRNVVNPTWGIELYNIKSLSIAEDICKDNKWDYIYVKYDKENKSSCELYDKILN